MNATSSKENVRKELSNQPIEINTNETLKLQEQSRLFQKQYLVFLDWKTRTKATRKKIYESALIGNVNQFDNYAQGVSAEQSQMIGSLFYQQMLEYENQINKFFNRKVVMAVFFQDGSLQVMDEAMVKDMYAQAGSPVKLKNNAQQFFVSGTSGKMATPQSGLDSLSALNLDDKTTAALQQSINNNKNFYSQMIARNAVYNIDGRQEENKIGIIHNTNVNELNSTKWEQGKNKDNTNKMQGAYTCMLTKVILILQGNAGVYSEGYLNYLLAITFNKDTSGKVNGNSDIESKIYYFWRDYVYQDNIKAAVRADIQLKNYIEGSNLEISVKGGKSEFGLESPLQFYSFATSFLNLLNPNEYEFSEQGIDKMSSIIDSKIAQSDLDQLLSLSKNKKFSLKDLENIKLLYKIEV